MKVLVASVKSQGFRTNDFMNADPGEVVTFVGFECDRGTVDDKCGCKRALSGLKSHKATTTAEVAELDLTLDDIKEQIRVSLTEGGWLKDGEGDPHGLLDATFGDFLLLVDFAKGLDVGTPIERRGNILRSRPDRNTPYPRQPRQKRTA